MNTPEKKLTKLYKIAEKIKYCRDFYNSEVYNKNYLIQRAKETDTAYKLRAETTPFTNMLNPIINGISGAITKTPAITTGTENTENVNGEGDNLQTFINKCTTFALIDGMACVSVESVGQGAFFKLRNYNDLLSYHYDDDNVLSQVVFKDITEIKNGRFGVKEQERFVVFTIGGGEVWHALNNKIVKVGEWENNLNYIPVAFIKTGNENGKLSISPPFYDIAKLNNIMFNYDSGLSNVLNVVGNPIPLFFGEPFADVDGDKSVIVGANDALVFNDKQKQGLEFAEIQGNGVDKLQERVLKLGRDIDNLAFNFLTTKTHNTKIDAEQSQSKNSSFISRASTELERAFNLLLSYRNDIDNIKSKATITFKKDFTTSTFNAEQMNFYKDLKNNGHISLPTFLDILNKSENNYIFDIEKETALIND